MSISLTPQERARFSEWLEDQAKTGQEIIAQMMTMPAAIMEVAIAKERMEATAALIIARKLRETSDDTIG
jgi:hypothetical protein